MAVNKRLLQGAAAAGGLTPSEHFGVVLYEGDGSSSHSINGGKFGAAFYGNGSNSSISVLPLSFNLQPYSVSCWFNTHDIANYKYIWSASTSTSDGFLEITSSAKLHFYFYDSSATLKEVTSTTTLSANTWYHAVALWDGSNIKLYLNGSLEGSDTATSMRSFNAGYFSIGALGTSFPFKGKIDQFRVFTKALSSSEVSTLYAETASTAESLDPLSEDTTDTLQVLGDSSCIATYRFENDETDLSGSYDGTGTEIQYAAGRYGQAASFNGSSSGIDLPNLGISGSQSRTVSFWFNLNTTPSGTEQLYSQGTNNLKEAFNIQLTSSAKVQVSYAGREWDSTTALSTGQWYHILVTYNGGNIETSSNTEIYINGTEETLVSGGGSSTGSASTSNTSYSLGYRTNISTLYVDGKIDQVRIFNKAISASEVTTLYQENSLVASYRFEGNANDDTRNYDGTASNVTYEYGLNFTPDFVWIKERSAAESHRLFDTTRGATKRLFSDNTNAESTATDSLTSFDTGGFTVGSSAAVNQDGQDYVGWCLKANGGTTSSNTDGTITSTVQVNEDAGFSIVKYTGAGGVDTIGHGLSAAPEMIIVKSLGHSASWYTYHIGLDASSPEDYNVRLNQTDARQDSLTYWNDTAPTNSVFTLGTTTGVSQNGTDFIAYCFHSVDSFSKFGSYEGTAASGNIVETGFEPAFLMLKNADSTGNWEIVDNKRSPNNPRNIILEANTSGTSDDLTSYEPDIVGFLSNGFVINDDASTITGSTNFNKSGNTYIYMAFAADPDTEQPTVAKSFSTVAYTGNGGTNSIEGLGFSPGLIWLKDRDTTYPHYMYDVVRGPLHGLRPSNADAESTNLGVSSFDSDGFTLDSNAGANQGGSPNIAWVWKADDNEPTINTEGSIDSLVSANANAGFSIVSYTGNGSTATQTIGHGLSQAPELILQKAASTVTTYGTNNWVVGGTLLGAGGYMFLNNTAAKGISTDYWSNTIPTASVFSVSGGPISTRVGNELNGKFINYCFHSVSGYSKIGSYTGNATSNTVTTGFQPDWIMIKQTSASGQNWIIHDSVRTGNPHNQYLMPSSNAAESSASSTNAVNFLSNGFELIGTGNATNGSGATYIYMAFKIN